MGFFITREWVHQYATDRGGFTRDQIEALGIRWPPSSGWIDRSIGKLITDSQKLRFEQALTKKQAREAACGKIFPKREVPLGILTKGKHTQFYTRTDIPPWDPSLGDFMCFEGCCGGPNPKNPPQDPPTDPYHVGQLLLIPDDPPEG